MTPTVQDIEQLKKKIQQHADTRARAEGALEVAYQQLEQLTGTRSLEQADAMLEKLEREEQAAKQELENYWQSLHVKYGDLIGAV